MNKRNFQVGKRKVGEGQPLYFIADIAANHDGDIKRAYKLIELAKEAGADAAKFQNFKAKTIVSRRGFECLGGKLSHQAAWTKSVYEVYQDASIPYDWTAMLKEKCDEVGIEYMTSPYDFESVDHVDTYLNAYKIGSGDITWLEIIKYIGAKGKPVFLATGASEMEDVLRAMRVLKEFTEDIVLMQCNTNYTASIENFKYINLNVLKSYREQFPNVVLGLSDHTLGHSTVLGAVALGAVVFEKHFTDSNERVGPDHKFSMTPESWKEMVIRANEVYQSLGDGIKRIEDNERDAAVIQRRALRFLENLPMGKVICKEHLFPVRPIPVDGIPPFEIDKLLGKKLTKDVNKDDYIKWEDID